MRCVYFIIFILAASGCSTTANRLPRRDIAGKADSNISCLEAANSLIKASTSSSLVSNIAKPNQNQIENIQTLTISSGIQVKGKFTTFKRMNEKGEVYYYGTQGPTELLFNGKVIPGQDTKQHPQGFSSPLGNLKITDKPLEDLSVTELKKIGIEIGKEVTIEYRSGVIVQGRLKEITNKNGKNIIFTFENETTEVIAPDGTMLFERAWGIYDMAIGKSFINTSDEWSKSIPAEVILNYKRKLFNKQRQNETIKEFKENGIEYIYSKLKNKGFRPVVLNEMVSTEELWEKIALVNSKKGYYGIPIDTGDFNLEHGEFSHAFQFYTIAKDMSEGELKTFKSIFRQMEKSPAAFDEIWRKFFEASGSSMPDSPQYWKTLVEADSL